MSRTPDAHFPAGPPAGHLPSVRASMRCGRVVALLGLFGAMACVPAGGGGGGGAGGEGGGAVDMDGGTDGSPNGADGAPPTGDAAPPTSDTGRVGGDGPAPQADMAPGESDLGPPSADMDPGPDVAPAGDPERCNGRDDDGDGDVDEGAVCPIAAAALIAAPGNSFRLEGSLDDESPTWQRFDANCGVRAAGDFYFRAFHIVNLTGRAQVLALDAAWGEVDGFLHVFGEDFGPLDEDCRAGSDDDTGITDSFVGDQAIAVGETLTVVASTYNPETTLPAFTIDVRTVPGSELDCGDGADDDDDGAVDCDDPDCADAPVCDACFGVECLAGARCAEGACVDFATPLAAVGASITLEGALPADAPTFHRATDFCAPTGESVHYAAFPVVNRTGAARAIRLDARWADADGMLLVYADPFDPGRPGPCLVADDDTGGRLVGSRIERVRIEPDEVVVVVAAGDQRGITMERFEVELTTLDDDGGTELLCDDRLDEDRDGTPDCGDWDCVEADHCRPCADVACDAGDRCVDGRCVPVDGAAPIELPFEGRSIVVAGAIDADDPQWTRPTVDCAAGEEAGFYYEVVRVATRPGYTSSISVTAEWVEADGFMHIFEGPFDPASVEGCLAGNDDDDGVRRSRIDDVPVERNGQMTVVLSTYRAEATVDAYTLWITTEPR